MAGAGVGRYIGAEGGLYARGTEGTRGAEGGPYDRGMEGTTGAARGTAGIMGCIGAADGPIGRGV